MTKTPAEVEKMATSGALLASVFALLDRTPLAGMTTMQVNDLVEVQQAFLPTPYSLQPVWQQQSDV